MILNRWVMLAVCPRCGKELPSQSIRSQILQRRLSLVGLKVWKIERITSKWFWKVVIYITLGITIVPFSHDQLPNLVTLRGGSISSARRGAGFPWGWWMREPYCPLSSAVCNAAIPTLPLFEMAESACLPFCYVLHYLLFIKFISAFYHVCVTGQLL
jgi:hypothetical protein